MLSRHTWRLRRALSALILLAALSPAGAFAQTADAEDADQTYAVTESLDAPRSDASESYQRMAERYRARTEPTYAVEIDGNLASGQRVRPETNDFVAERVFNQPDFGGVGVFLVVLLIVGGLFLLLKFGAGGTLLSKDPEDKPAQVAPTAWQIDSAQAAKDPRGLLEQIAAMTDRSEAMVLLLRHCLLSAAETTSTRFARADTERLAFRRVPSSYAQHAGLKALLRHAELAHYGGRPVGDADFDMALEIGRTILGRRAANG